jgi:hypothetical protein
MKKLIEYLVLIGYIGEGCTSLQFSSVVENGVWVRYKKDNSCFLFGLNEKGNPPTIIFPRKRTTEKNENWLTERECTDAEMLGYLLSNKAEFIFNELYCLSIC